MSAPCCRFAAVYAESLHPEQFRPVPVRLFDAFRRARFPRPAVWIPSTLYGRRRRVKIDPEGAVAAQTALEN